MELPPTIPPKIGPPPVEVPPPTAPHSPPKSKNLFQRIWGGLLAFIAATWKFAYPVFKLAKGGKLLLTAGSMLVSIGFYSVIFGWKFAVGFVICIFIHEMGHVFAAWRIGLPVSAPIFIPFMGAIILSRGLTKSAFHGAIMGYGGPLFGALAAFGCWGIYYSTGSALFLGLAYTGFFINLFNMLPMYPLDGGWITGAISPYIWIAGLIGLVAFAFTGHMSNPFIWLLLILSIPRIVSSFKRGTMDQEGVQTTKIQKVGVGFAYLFLCGVLVFGVAQTQTATLAYRYARQHQTVQ